MAKAAGLNTWLNRTTKVFVQQTSSGEMERRFSVEVFHDGTGEPISNANWIHAPDMSAITGQLSKYWIITGDVVTLMSQTERDVVDLTTLNARRDNTANQLDVVEDVMRAFALVVLDEINVLRAQHSLVDRTIVQLKTAIRNKLGN